ncbi:hypothetical protein AAFC00_000695 [Neodothiora populina]|uniref:FAD dependent oxidoreductase domain-containing protein n=1 Tax=Neodothiora populina TaxID=2781224 RepID=A0ABR3PDP9_9PEZI
MSLVIIGGGIVGLSIAYYASLAQPERRIIIIDSEKELLLSASGFSGGYIVRDWFSPSVLPLSELSYSLHRSLAADNDGLHQWGYTESTAFSLVVEQPISEDGTVGKAIRGEDWLLHGASRAEVAKQHLSGVIGKPIKSRNNADPLVRNDGTPVWANVPAQAVFEKISSASGCAQVEPRELCEWLLHQCHSRGVQIYLSTKVLGLVEESNGKVKALAVQREVNGSVNRTTLSCKDVVIAAGCWSPRVYDTLLGKRMSPSVTPLPGYSMVVRSPRYDRNILQENDDSLTVPMSHATFYPPTSSWSYSPEAMARMTRSGKPEIYVAGLNDESITLPVLAGQSRQLMERSKLDDLKQTTVALTGKPSDSANYEDDLEVVREGLCFRPVSTSGRPIISPVAGVQISGGGSLYVATGHGPWGITLSLGTGLVVSEMLQGKEPSVPIAPFALDEEILRARL